MDLRATPTDLSLEEANERLRMSESRFHTLLGLGNEGIVIIAADGKPAFVSSSIKRVMGYTDGELMQLSLGALVHPDDLESIVATQSLAIANPGIPYEYPTSRRKHKDGSYRWVEATIINLLDDPSINGIVTHFRDITQRKIAQDKVIENGYKFRTLIERSSDGIAILTAEGTPVYLSPAIEKLGYTQEEAMQMGMLTLVNPDDLPPVWGLIGDVLSSPGKTSPPVTVRIKHKDGTWRWIESTLTNMLHDPLIGGIVNNYRDITARKEDEQRLIYTSRLYNFISQINQTIVHVPDEQHLFDAVCQIAVKYGNFEFAWIGIATPGNRKITMQASAGTTKADINYFKDYQYDSGGPIDIVLSGEDYFVVSEINKRKNAAFNKYAAGRGFKSAVFFAIRKAGKIIGTFNLYSSEKNFFNEKETALLREASIDISFALDVFEKDFRRTVAEKALQHKELRLSQAQAIAHLGSWELNIKTGDAVWTEEALRIYGLSEDQKIQSYEIWLSYVHPEDLKRVMKITKKAKANHENASFYHRIIRNDGSIRYVYTQSQHEYDNDGSVIGITGVVHDITDLTMAQETALKAAKEKITILESIRDAFFAVDRDWIVTYWNKEAASILYTAKEEILGKNLWEVFNESIGTVAYVKYHEAFASGEVSHFEHYHEPLDIWFAVSAYPSGNGLSVYFKDISAKKHADAERQKIVEELVQHNKGLEQFSYIVSHNLRAPVANIKGLATELSEGSHSNEMEAMLKKEMISSVKRLDEVIVDLNGILQMKREVIEKNEYVDLSEMVNNVRLGIINLIDREQVRIETDFNSAPGLMTIKSYLYSILFNLISNSIKYRNPNHLPHIFIRTEKTPSGIMIEFRDNGVGIDIKRKDQVFRLYKRFHNHVEGKGMGLFMVKTQVEMLGGNIAIDCTINQGTLFRIELPL